MKSSKFFVKSNYIKNAKNNWIFCDGRLLCHQSITFLQLKSVNIDKQSSDLVSESGSNYSGFSTLSQWQQYRTLTKDKGNRIHVLCNLFEFKSCEIKSVKFECVNKFAIKLIPSGFLRNKKLYLLPDLEDSLTEWCDIITGFITKTINFPTHNNGTDEACPITPPSTLKSANNDEKRHTFTAANDIYISLDDNDAYESTNQNEFHLVNIEPSLDSVKLKLHGCYLLKLDAEALELLNPTTRDLIHTFPYLSIRRFGAKDSMFRLEAGRHCSTGNGSFTFQVTDAAQIAEKVKENARRLKDRKSMNNSYMSVNRPSLSDISMHVEIPRNSPNPRLIGINSTSALTPDNLELEFPNVVVEETLSCLNNAIDTVDTSQKIMDIMEHSNNDLGNEDELLNEDAMTNDLQEERRDYCEETVVDSNKNSSPTKHRHWSNLISDSEFHNSKSETLINETTEEISKEIRPTSLFDTSNTINSFFNTPSSSINPLKTAAAAAAKPILTDYKASESTFFKYRQVQKPPVVRALSLLVDEDLTVKEHQTVSITTESGPIELQTPKRSPPPLFPKPKTRILLEERYDQTEFREFDRMLEDLQLSLR